MTWDHDAGFAKEKLMDPQRWTKIESLYHAALTKEPGERSAYLDTACAEDPELRGEVESLLGCADAELVSPVADGYHLAPGFHLGSYEIIAPLGKGGMGEVYRARDAKLLRDVAIKVLPREFQSDRARLVRFEREAQLLASLNHPQIGAIYGLEGAEGIRFLVLELVEGLTLAERIGRRALLPDEVLAIGAQIMEALKYAHERNVIHRDLKPANIKLTGDGNVKVLDFGLAKALADPAPASDRANSPTVTIGGTAPGIILGTAAYMSPEQAQGKPLDKRTDIWSFGGVLYEMLTGKKLFHGETVAETLASVLKESPDFTRVPPHFVPLLGKCLEKDRKRRLQDIGDAMLLLEQAQAPPVREGRSWLWPSVAAAFALATLALAFLYFRPKPAPREDVTRFDSALPAGVNLISTPVVSPNGRKIAVAGLNRVGAAPQIWIQSLDAVEPQPLSGTAGTTGGSVVWSPDSRYLAFNVGNGMRKIETSGGPTQKVCDTPVGLTGGFWTQDGKIVFGTESPGGLLQCSAAGGAVSPLTGGGENDSDPSLLSDGRHFIYVHFKGPTTMGEVYVGSIDGRREQSHTKMLLQDVSSAAYVTAENGSANILFLRNGILMAQGFDAKRLEMEGEAVPIPEPTGALVTGFSVSSTGVLVYRTSRAPLAQLSWFDRRGKLLGTVGDANTDPGAPAISHDGKRVAYARTDPQSGNVDIWLYDFARKVPERFTFDPAPEGGPVWSPDDSQIAFARGGGRGIYLKASDGSGSEKLVLSKKPAGGATSWSRDGFLLYQTLTDPKKLIDVWVLSVGDPGGALKPWPLLDSEAIERGARFSPDGHFVSYVSTESGQAEVYVRPFDASARSASVGPHWQISSNGGDGAHWSADGKELLYMAPDRTIMSVRVTTRGVFDHGAPEALFRSSSVAQFWEITPDAQRFLIPVPAGTNSVPSFKVVLNWSALLRH
jgi:serine/threonine protein kinase/Tol biopolymer transport system component